MVFLNSIEHYFYFITFGELHNTFVKDLYRNIDFILNFIAFLHILYTIIVKVY